ncbi:formylglycine-generating enzyme family protein [soil metagenome]
MRISIRHFYTLFVGLLLIVFLADCGGPAKVEPKISGPTGMILINGGRFEMGTSDGMPFEGPVHTVEVDPFFIDEHEVTVAQFNEFVRSTGYKTDAEKFGWSGVFDFGTREWTRVDGANWRHPEGPKSMAQPNEPVCQISWNDANEYAKWAGKRLPTEAEFEFAARGGLVQKKYAWGDDLKPGGRLVANWWQGTFPGNNTGEDGFVGRAPVESFAANGYGLYDMTGNVWEWCSDRFGEDYYQNSSGRNPKGPESGDNRVIRGGSFLCAENYCSNYRVAGRSQAEPDSGLDNLGFRCVRDVFH